MVYCGCEVPLLTYSAYAVSSAQSAKTASIQGLPTIYPTIPLYALTGRATNFDVDASPAQSRLNCRCSERSPPAFPSMRCCYVYRILVRGQVSLDKSRGVLHGHKDGKV